MNTQATKMKREDLRTHLTAFQEIQKQLAEAAFTFKEEVFISEETCGGIMALLQTLLQQAHACLTLFDEHKGMLPRSRVVTSAIKRLRLLNGSHTIQLRLEVDMFQSLVLRNDTKESVKQAKERIETHVYLQQALEIKAEELQKLLGTLEAMLADAPAASSSCTLT